MKKAFGIVEIIIAVSIFIIIASAGAVAVLHSFSANRLGEAETKAYFFAEEGIEAVRSLRNRGWLTPFLATDCSLGCGLSGPSSWNFTGTGNTSPEGFLRKVYVLPVNRDTSGNIVVSGGTPDPDTKKVTSTVTYQFTPTRLNSVSFDTYLTNFKKAIGGDWANPAQESTIDVSGNQNGINIALGGNYIYLVRAGGTPDFLVLDISNPTVPVSMGSLTLAGNPRGIHHNVFGNYLYVTSSDNNSELQIINIANPSSPALTGVFNATGNADGYGVYVLGSYAYLVLANNTAPEFYVVNITNPASPVLSGSLDLNGSANDVFVIGDYAYVASSDNTQELQVINITNPASPTLAGSLDLTGNSDAFTLAGFGTNLFVGRSGGTVSVVNISSPGVPILSGTYAGSGGGSVYGISISETANLLFLATSSGTAEFQVVNIQTLNSPVLLGSLDLADDLRAVVYDLARDISFCVSNDNAAEFISIKPL